MVGCKLWLYKFIYILVKKVGDIEYNGPFPEMELHLFTDLKTKGSFTIKTEDLNVTDISKKLADMRQAFAKAAVDRNTG